MRNHRLIAIWILAVAMIPAAVAQQATISAAPKATIQPMGEGHHFNNGYTFHYQAEWRLWKSGTATLKIDQSGELEHVTATAESSGAVALLYHVQDRLESYVDRKSFCSIQVMKHTEEGLRRRESTLRFDGIHGKAILDERNLRDGDTKHQETDTPECVTDVLSGIFYVGAQRLEPGLSYLFPVNDGGKTVNTKAYVEGREEVKTEAGTFKTVRVGVSADGGTLKGRGKVWIWYTDDASHLPVQMRSRLFWGTLTLRLTRVEK